MFQVSQKTTQSKKQDSGTPSKGAGLTPAQMMKGQEMALRLGAPAQMMAEEEEVQGKAIQKAPEEEGLQMKASGESSSGTAQSRGTTSSSPENAHTKMVNSFVIGFQRANIQQDDSSTPLEGVGVTPAQMMKGQEMASMLGAPAQMMAEEEEVQGKAIQKAPEEEGLQMKASGESSSGSAQSTGSATSLPENVQAKMENSFGTSFQGVNIQQNDSSATNMGALAYTQGNNVHFAPGQYNPDSSKGQELIGHELTHVVQQREGRVSGTQNKEGLNLNSDTSLEDEADVMGKQAAQGKMADVSGKGSGVQREESNGEKKEYEHAKGEKLLFGGVTYYKTSIYTNSGDEYKDEYDTIWSISKKFGISIDTIVELNGGEENFDKEKLLQGQFIILDKEKTNTEKNEIDNSESSFLSGEEYFIEPDKDYFSAVNMIKSPPALAPSIEQDENVSSLRKIGRLIKRMEEGMKGHAEQSMGMGFWGNAKDSSESPATKLKESGKYLGTADAMEIIDLMGLLVLRTSNKIGKGPLASHKERIGEFNSRFLNIKKSIKAEDFQKAAEDLFSLNSDINSILQAYEKARSEELLQNLKNTKSDKENTIESSNEKNKQNNQNGSYNSDTTRKAKPVPGAKSRADYYEPENEMPKSTTLTEGYSNVEPEKEELTEEEVRWKKLEDKGLNNISYYIDENNINNYVVDSINGSMFILYKEEVINEYGNEILNEAYERGN